MTSPDSPPTKLTDSPGAFLLGENPRGFTPDQQQTAREIKARIQSGETVPLEELKAFLKSAEAELSKTRLARNVKEKQTDVDFF